MNNISKIILVIISFLVLSCVHTNNKIINYKLTSISDDTQKNNANEVIAVVTLHNNSPNEITVVQLDKNYSAFKIYKQENGKGDYKSKGTLRTGKPTTIGQMIDEIHLKFISHQDTDNPSINDRYKIIPIVNGAELTPLPISYNTSELSYYNEIEGKK